MSLSFSPLLMQYMHTLLYSFILHIFIMAAYVRTQAGGCSTPDEYGLVSMSTKPISLCGDSRCSAAQLYSCLVPGVTFKACKLGGSGSPSAFIVQLVQKSIASTIANQAKVCGSATDSTYNSGNCIPSKNFKFTPKANRKPFEIYIVVCGETGGAVNNDFTEFPDKNLARAQISMYDAVESSTITYQQYPSATVRCIPDNKLKLATTVMTLSDASLGLCTGRDCTFTTNKLMVGKVGVVRCSVGIAAMDVTFKMTIVFGYNSNAVSKYGHVRTSPVFDAGDVVSCLVIQKKNVTAKNIQPVTTQAARSVLFYKKNGKNIYLDTDGIDGGYISNSAPTSLILLCYFGNRSQLNVKFKFYAINQIPIKVGARFLTLLSTMTDKVIDTVDTGDSFNIQVDTEVKCNRSGYPSSNVMVGTFFVDKPSYPLSAFKTFAGYVHELGPSQSISISKMNNKYRQKSRFIYCIVNGVAATPVALFSGDKPNVKWYPINPPWMTKYKLKKFMYCCTGKSINDISVTCNDCPPDRSMVISNAKKPPHTICLVILPDLTGNLKVTYTCKGLSDMYQPTHDTISLDIITSQYTDLDPNKKLYVAGIDYVSCVSQFTIFHKSKTIKQMIPVMTYLTVEGIEYFQNNSKGIKIKKYPKTVTYQFCCPPFLKNVDEPFKSTYQCVGKRKLNVAKDFRVQYSVDIKNLFAGTLVKCFICVNFTTDATAATCQGEHKIPTKIRMMVTKPDNTKTDSKWTDSITTPKEEMRADKSGYYKISEYAVKIGCMVRGTNEPLKSIQLKSCNVNPPDIRIDPPDKTMFVVGDIFTCSTESVYCKNGLTYTIYVQRGGEPSEKKESGSFALQRKHTGNNIVIKCAAGEGEIVTNNRTIRVENKPYNVTINTVLPIMIYTNYLRCNSLGFPPPTITWTQLKGRSPLRISESFVLIGPWDYSGQYTVSCEAKNKRGSVTTTANFEIFNQRIVDSDFTGVFYAIVPILTIFYIGILLGGLLLIFQENFFNIPFFSSGIHEASKGSSNAFKDAQKPRPLPSISDPKASIPPQQPDE